MPSNQKTAKAASRRPRVVLAGGGSGGHITPLLSLAHALKQKSPQTEIIYIGRRGEKLIGLTKRLKIFDRHYQINSGKLRRYHGQSWLAKALDIKTLFWNIIDLFKVTFGYFQARQLLRRLKPDVVLSKGGYVALPTGWAAHRLRIPIITHDSDSTPGLANRLIGKHAALHATADSPVNYERFYPADSIRQTGIPLDERLKPVNKSLQAVYKKQLGLPADSFVLLITGGGLGSQSINQKILELAPEFLKNPKNHIIHFAGGLHQSNVEAEYQNRLSPDELARVEVFTFSADFYVYTASADLVVTRAGATTLAELAAQHKACIVIPADFLSDAHQTANVKKLLSKKAVIQAENSISSQNLLRQIRRLEQNQHLRTELGQNLGSIMATDGASRLADLILGFTP